MLQLDYTIRSEGIGCSELGAMLGVDPFRDLHALYVEKCEGLLIPPTKRMLAGKAFEAAVLEAFREETGIDMRPSFNVTYKHPEFDRYHLFATPDGLGDEAGYEGKLLAWDQRRQYGPPEDEVPIIPPRVELQVRGSMEVMDKPRWYIAVWCGADRLSVYTIERDREFGQFILNQAEDVWKKYFEPRVRPPIGGSKISAQWLKQKWPKNRLDIRPATDGEIKLLNRYAQVRVEAKKLEKEQDLLENQLKEAVAEHGGLEWPHGRFTYRRTKDGTEVRWMDMAIALRTFYIKYPTDPKREAEERQKVTDDHTVPKPGHRFIRFDWDGQEENANAA
ncbi:MAG TPA: YqaJ viral recombinase family protein [Acidobacteriaceae bacterium]|jgi:predicted phage-related endonuclease